MNFVELSREQQIREMASRARGAIGLLPEEETAAVLEVEPSTLATWRSQGKGPDYVKLGKGVFYTINTLSAWVNTELAKQIEARRAA
jgi:hypothetical protein